MGQRRAPPEDARTLSPQAAMAAFERAIALHQRGLLAEAEQACRSILQSHPSHFETTHLLGVVLWQRRQFEQAEHQLRHAIQLNPSVAATYINYGNVLFDLARYADALASFEAAIALDPGDALAHFNRGNTLQAIERPDEAAASYDRAIALKPDYEQALNNRGNALTKLGRIEAALVSYDQAIAVRPGYADAFNNRGNILLALKRNDEALANYDRAADLDPRQGKFHHNRGAALAGLRRHPEAFAAFDRALAIDPGLPGTEGARLHEKMRMCAWDGFEAESSHLIAEIRSGRLTAVPFQLLPVASTASDQLDCARRYVRANTPALAQPLWRGERYRHDRLRIAYLSTDFRDHPVSYLLADIIERHDRARFETIAVAFGPDSSHPMRSRLKSSFERFIEPGIAGDRDVAVLLRNLEVDIAVDLMGFTSDTRNGVLAHRPAPVAVSYLGYAGTSGADTIDYILADRVVIPDEQRSFFSEKVAYLPDCYMVSDRTRTIAAQAPSRTALGLPETGFVFCSFNSAYKITPEVFTIWMRLLSEVDGSILWLSATNDRATANLRREAETRGISAERLVFAPRTEHNEDHLARIRAADLFLDTWPYNAHATACDALGAGLPILTCIGSTFAGRVAASLLNAAGLPELISNSPAGYQELALKLARDPDLLAQIRGRLAKHRDSQPLFDAGRFTRHLEAAYMTMSERAERGEPPAGFAVEPIDGSPPERPAPSVETELARALTLHRAGRLDEAEHVYRSILQSEPSQFDATHLLGVIFWQRGCHEDAERQLSQAIRLDPDAAAAHNNRGNALFALGRFDEAVTCYDRALALNPRDPQGLVNRGNALRRAGRLDSALTDYDGAIGLNPNYPEAFVARGNALRDLRQLGDALASYDQAIGLRPDYPDALANRGATLRDLNRFEEALESCDRAVALKPDDASAWNNRGLVLQDLRRLDEALASYDRAYRLKPDLPGVEGARLQAKMHLCDWSTFQADCEHFLASVRSGTASSVVGILLAVASSPGDQLSYARRHVAERQPPSPALWRGERYAHDRIRVAYLSTDFRDHPVSHLLAGLIEHHDRTRFEPVAVSFGAADEADPMRARLKAAFERFIEAGDRSDREVASLLRQGEIDIAVDLMGHTGPSRSAVLAHRPAPVAVSYLGYAGTSGTASIDYILADRTVIPDEDRQFFSEQAVYLPDTFMVADNSRRIAEPMPRRADLGLPPQGFVFCSFNNAYKLTPDVFTIWMRLLSQVEGSVLWMSEPHASAVRNLRSEAQARGVEPERLIFAPRMDRNDDHLARLRVADLFLDCWPYNAHATACDALWAGLPVLTCPGMTFAGRVAASLLGAVGMPELIARSPAEYETLAVKLARDTGLLGSLRTRLQGSRTTHPLFNTARLARHVEAAYTTMWERSRRGEPPASFAVEPESSSARSGSD